MAQLAVVLAILGGCSEEAAEGSADSDSGDMTVVELVDAVAETSPTVDTDETTTEAASEIAGEVADVHQDGSCRPASAPRVPDSLPDMGLILEQPAAPWDPFLATVSEGRIRAVWLHNTGQQALLKHCPIEHGSPAAIQTSDLPATAAVLPAFAAGSDGRVHIVWLDNKSWVLYHTAISADGSVSQAVPLSEEGRAANSPQVAVDEAGRVSAVWYEGTDSGFHIMAASVAAGLAGQPMDTGLTMNRTYGILRLDLVADAAGRLHLAYEDVVANTEYPDSPDIFYTMHAAGSLGEGWSEPVNLTQALFDWQYSSEPHLAIDFADHPHLLWVEQNHDPEILFNFEVHYRFNDGTTWNDAVDISREGNTTNILSPGWPRMRWDCAGRSHFGWLSRPPDRPSGCAVFHYTPDTTTAFTPILFTKLDHDVGWVIDERGYHHFLWVAPGETPEQGVLRYVSLHGD